jgi:hypothetical protein
MNVNKILKQKSSTNGKFQFEDVAQTQVGHEEGEYGYFIIESKRRKRTQTGTSIPWDNSAVIYFEDTDPFENIHEILGRRIGSEFDLEAGTGFIPADGEYEGKNTPNTDISEVRVNVEESKIRFYCFDDSRDLIGAASIPIATAFEDGEYTDEENLQRFHAMVDEASESFTDARESKEDTMDKVHRTALEKTERICGEFHSAAKQLRDTHSNSDSFEIENEYSVQSLLHSYLKLEFDDVRAEEYNPSYAGKQPRIDFLIEAHDIMIEVKHARPDHGKEDIREELAIDKDHYRKKDYDQLICFIYDPDEVITNPDGFITDLEFEEPSVTVLISP